MTFASDLRYALRSFAHTPGITATLLLTIALGVGGNAAMFGFVGGLVALDVQGAAPDAAERFGRIAALLAAASALILFLAASTVTNLLLARARGRAHEMAVRTALGADRTRLVGLCLADSLVITVVGGSLGVVIAYWTASLFPMLFFVDDAEQLSMAPNLLWLGVASGVWLMVLLGAALSPVVPVWRQVPWVVLRQESAGAPAGAVRLRNHLATSQIAVCCVLLLVTGVMRDDLQSTLRTARGSGLGDLLVVTVDTLGAGPAYLGAAATALREESGVGSFAWTSTLPAGRAGFQVVRVEQAQPLTRRVEFDTSTFDPATRTADDILPVEGRPFAVRDAPDAPRVALVNEAAADRHFAGDAVARLVQSQDGTVVRIIGVLPAVAEDEPPALFYYENQVPPGPLRWAEPFYAVDDLTRRAAEFDVTVVSPAYFALFDDPVIEGVGFEADMTTGASVAVISQAGADAWFDGDAIGGALITPRGERVDVIGVVRAAPLGAAERGGLPMLFRPLEQAFERRMSLAVQATRPPDETMRAMERVLGDIPGGAVLTPVSTFEEHLVRYALAPERVASAMLGVMALGAIVLSIAGIHGAMADLVARRRPELAMRIALGAQPGRLVTQVVRAAWRLGLAGAGVGLALALLAAPVLAAVLGRAGLPSLSVLAAALAVIAVLVTASSAVPAWRAVSVDPREVMR